MRKLITLAVAAMMATVTLTSCSNDDDDIAAVPRPEEQQLVLNCTKPDYLKAGDRVAMISPSYFTPTPAATRM